MLELGGHWSGYILTLRWRVTRSFSQGVTFGHLLLGALLFDVEHYSTNAFRHEKYCINPVFQALDDFDQLSRLEWVCQTKVNIKLYHRFFADVVYKEVAVPRANSEATFENLESDQDNNASSMISFHLAGMNLESWEFQNPSESNNRFVQSVQRVACNTYFPKGAAGCTPKSASTYFSGCPDMI